MKGLKYLSWVYLLATSYIIGNSVSKVKANDCEHIEKAINLFGNDLKTKYLSSNVTDCCTFEGVVCKDIDNEKHVVEIRFIKYRSFDGKESEAIKEISNLKYLESLTFTSFLFGGRFPVGFGKIKSLKTLNLTHNTFLTPIPDELGDLVNLEKLDLSFNYLKGSIPSSFGNLVNLKILNIGHNRLRGVIPFEFRNMTSLEQLVLDNNISLSGYVPLMEDLVYCSYASTNLCNLEDSKCKKADYDCSKEDIENTDRLNGNPDSKENSYLKKPPYHVKIVPGILIILIITIAILLYRKRNISNNEKQYMYLEN